MPVLLLRDGSCCAGLLQGDAIASLVELHGDVGEELAGLATEHGQLCARLAEAEAAERKLDALAQLQQRLADFGVLLSRGTLSKSASLWQQLHHCILSPQQCALGDYCTQGNIFTVRQDC